MISKLLKAAKSPTGLQLSISIMNKSFALTGSDLIQSDPKHNHSPAQHKKNESE